MSHALATRQKIPRLIREALEKKNVLQTIAQKQMPRHHFDIYFVNACSIQIWDTFLGERWDK